MTNQKEFSQNRIDGSIKPAKREEKDKLSGEEEKEEVEECGNKKRKIRDEPFVEGDIEYKKPRQAVDTKK